MLLPKVCSPFAPESILLWLQIAATITDLWLRRGESTKEDGEIEATMNRLRTSLTEPDTLTPIIQPPRVAQNFMMIKSDLNMLPFGNQFRGAGVIARLESGDIGPAEKGY